MFLSLQLDNRNNIHFNKERLHRFVSLKARVDFVVFFGSASGNSYARTNIFTRKFARFPLMSFIGLSTNKTKM